MAAMSQSTFKFLGIPGCLGQASFNRSALLAAQNLLPEGAILELFDLGTLPLFSAAVTSHPSAEVLDFQRKVHEADAILISIPEYHYSVSAILQNATLCAASPSDDSPWVNKPFSLLTPSTSVYGAAEAQNQIRQHLLALSMRSVGQHALLVSGELGNAFDGSHQLAHAASQHRLKLHLASVIHEVRTVQQNHRRARRAPPQLLSQLYAFASKLRAAAAVN